MFMSPANLEDTYKIERKKWDGLAPQELDESYILRPGDDFMTWARRSAQMTGTADFLGDLTGKRVLEYGCGFGEMTVRLAKSGAEVSTFDLSPASVSAARKRAVINNVRDKINFSVCPAESLPYPDDTFDVVLGKAILHHLHLATAQPHLFRVLKPGGKAVFSEPLGMNPILNFVRDWVPYPKKNPRGADRPLNYDDIRGWARNFRELEIKEIQLLSMLERGLGQGKRLPLLRKADNVLLKRVSLLRRFCRYAVILITK